ncbi:MAG: filamentous hemagglutinin N-terminal domain-containing protein, partial [Betaproteobacteria bacterium]|nr:filamentous hemagglutinin N-terminal domain-containing protein [Betaproteobacteria bacterium]
MKHFRRFRLSPVVSALRQAGCAALAAGTLVPGLAYTQLPAGGAVTHGTAAIRNVSPTQQRITQASDKAIINWQSFSIGQPNSVVFAQPGANSVVLNRVVGNDPSSIFGSLSANGQVFLVNPHGVFFGPGSRVDVTGLVATTLNIRDGDFLSGNYLFSRDALSPATAKVINEGRITAAPGGYVVLAGDYAANRGVVEARGGTVTLASGSRTTLDMQGDGLVRLAVSEKTISDLAGVENAGQLIADGGRVVMTAMVAREVSGTVVNNSGVVQARGTAERDGAIYLTGSGGDVISSGALDASGSTASGGTVQILGERVGLIDNASVNASGATGGGTVLVGGDFQGRPALSAVDGNPIQNARRTYIGPNATITADAVQSGDGGKVIVWADGDTRYYGNISARGGALSG